LSWAFSLLLVPLRETGAGHAFAEAAVFEEVLLQAADLFVEQVVDDLDQANDDVGADVRVGVFDALAEGLVGSLRQAIERAEAFRIRVIAAPLLEAAGPEKITVVREQLFETGARDVGQFDFGFLGGAGGLVAFPDAQRRCGR